MKFKKPDLVIDATDGIMGRVAAYSAKQSLLGKRVAIVNCNDVLITGNFHKILNDFKEIRNLGGWSPTRKPHIHRSPEKIMKRCVRGMLPYKKGHGAEALKRVICYNKLPKELEEFEKIEMKREIKVRAVKLGSISKEI